MRALGMWMLCLLTAAACDEGRGPDTLFCPSDQDWTRYVDPMIGSLGPGNVVPGALVPHGMVKLSPDTNAGAGSIDAYEYGNDRIEGFSHTHLQGPGGSMNGYSHILFMPTTGPLETRGELFASLYSHLDEAASPGYYAVTLEDYAVRAELTATAHAGLHRYTFPADGPARVLIDLGHSRGESRGGHIAIVDERTVEGFGYYNVHPLVDLVLRPSEGPTGDSTVYFHAVFSSPFSVHGTWTEADGQQQQHADADSAEGARIGAWLEWPAGVAAPVEVRVGISLVSAEQAAKNLAAEIGAASFDEIHTRARDTWNCYLGRIEVEGGSEAQRTVFYTALYHSLFAPADYTEAGGVFHTAADGVGQDFTWDKGRFYTDDWCAWDTFRTSRPLATLVEPETVDDVIRSYLHLYQQGGWLPKCTWHASGYSRVMIGNHGVAIIADALAKGFSGFDRQLAWEAVYKAGTEDNPGSFADNLCGYANLGTTAEYIEHGYVSHECDRTQSVSMTLEYAYNDWCTARMAEILDKPAEAQVFDLRAGNFRKHWNPDLGFMQGRMRDGSWVTSFDPADMSDFNDFCEASAWIYTWFVPHDPAALIALFGDEQTFLDRLDAFFAEGHFAPDNEPSFHVPYLYTRAGRPDETQRRVREILDTVFTTAPDGLPGNDDAGATSAWIVLSAMGLYPLAPGDGLYEISSPLFERLTLHLHPGVYGRRSFVIEAAGNGPANVYIQSASLDGQPHTSPRIPHSRIVSGGTLRFEMGPTPSTWGRP